MVDKTQIISAVTAAMEQAPKRKFQESIDITINLKHVDMAQPKNRIDETILLPQAIGVKKIAVLGKGDIVSQARNAGVDIIIGPEEIERLGGAPREARKLAGQYDYFLAETAVMPLVGRWLGQRLGPRGKMPQPIPMGQDITPIVERLRNSVKIRSKDRLNMSVKIGNTAMSADAVAENVDAVLKRVLGRLENGELNVRSVYVKTTMGPAVKVM
ncbi:50S ribosomal protein L1 [Methanocorpusculum vombati]|jgi:large subunit ribosomal protein L1|uniref:Large ribosomal subunit protein uL1 n=1 Tax=Methanocorpusculum vombati TaxID=3002864 RepID=A0ABT4IK33_9EURY|nr:50S ribosomal protein L1 [Methanocorpusculum vombati]MCZ9319226.1 50S ribosomal protein L1 [Methanocorpusculum sp.]MCZ0862089.1 50S ribosomal protein L1 [Methanocorpusculum vombati]MDE2520485.1 50S ribosomal protein L1 [Methanocorpusculum sp.]MDE2534411.1 50S ribosomal protein L1 [Methanocorpusculum sp.]MDE2546458.1 50S ribosomal protein L1 [Methanocorpusculum sp.]